MYVLNYLLDNYNCFHSDIIFSKLEYRCFLEYMQINLLKTTLQTS